MVDNPLTSEERPGVINSGVAEDIAKIESRQSLAATAVDQLSQSTVWSAVEALHSVADGASDTAWDADKHEAELMKGVPLSNRSHIMTASTLAVAKARRQRLLEDKETEQRLAAQTGVSAGVTKFAAALFDADLPLMFMTSGTYGAAKIAGKAATTVGRLTGSSALARIAGETAVGAVGGAQAGAIVGAVDMAARDDRDGIDLINGMVTMTLMGGALGGTVGGVLPDKTLWSEVVQREFTKLKTDITKQVADPASKLVQPKAPVADVTGNPHFNNFSQMGMSPEDARSAAYMGTVDVANRPDGTIDEDFVPSQNRRPAHLRELTDEELAYSNMSREDFEELVRREDALYAAEDAKDLMAVRRTEIELDKWRDQLRENDDSIGAARVPGTQQTALEVDALDVADMGSTAGPTVREWTAKTTNWRANTGWSKQKAKDIADPIVRILSGGATEKDNFFAKGLSKVSTIAVGDTMRLFHSSSPTANWTVANIFESASGVGRQGSTAALQREMYLGDGMRHWEPAFNTHWKLWNEKNGGIKNALTPMQSRAQYAREFRIKRDQWRDLHADGKPVSTFDKDWADIMEAADRTYDTYLKHMQGSDELDAVHGSRDFDSYKGYQNYDWFDQKFLEVERALGGAAHGAGRAKLVDAFEAAYLARNPSMQAVAETIDGAAKGGSKTIAREIAEAVVDRFTGRAKGKDAVNEQIMRIDNRGQIEEYLREIGMSEQNVKRIGTRLSASAEGKSKSGRLKHRNDLDLSTPIDGTEYTLADLMTPDIDQTVRMYGQGAAGSSALARKGIRSYAELNTVKGAIIDEMDQAGEGLFAREHLDAMFSQFGSGAHGGYLLGRSEQGPHPVVGAMLQAARASMLQQLGLTQIMDTAHNIAANGLVNALKPMRDFIGGVDKPALKKLLNDLEGIQVILGQDHRLFAPHLHLDEVQTDSSKAFRAIRHGVGQIEKATGYASGMHHVTRMQQVAAGAATANRVLRDLNKNQGRTFADLPASYREFGFTPAGYGELMARLADGTIDVSGPYPALNTSKWSNTLKEEFGAGMLRSVNTQVQKQMIGEKSVWANTNIGALLGFLKGFPMTAIQKQALRSYMSGGKQNFMTTAMWQMGVAYAVVLLKDTLNGNDRDLVDQARLAISYSANVGSSAMVIDPITTMLGFDSLNVSPYGRFTTPWDTPVFERMADLSTAPASMARVLTGTAEKTPWQDDYRNAQAMFFANLIGMKRLFDPD